jgi:hypothetical protein
MTNSRTVRRYRISSKVVLDGRSARSGDRLSGALTRGELLSVGGHRQLSVLPHWFGGADATAVEILILFGAQGERTHLRAGPTR